MLMFSYAYFSDRQKKYNAVQSYADCVSAGNPIIETYPQTCKIPGKIFTNTSQISIKKTEEEKVKQEETKEEKQEPGFFDNPVVKQIGRTAANVITRSLLGALGLGGRSSKRKSLF